MAKVKLTKNELKRQKDMLKRFQRYLPTLVLKKQQLQMVIRQVEAEVKRKLAEQKRLTDDLMQWIAVFGEDLVLEDLVSITGISTDTGNIAGIDIPVFEGIEFEQHEWDLFRYPLWVDTGVRRLKELLALDAEIRVLEKQKELIEEELRITTQRVNLFEKVKIPEAKENIRMIRIYLGDQQTAAVVRGKIAKSNIVEV
ncbi:MAG: V-type ATP synthase subunit D [Spirochaetaceae bacterium]|nr:MAG: V-type ATP synthase subunit D [Spirochaetaceae bacterium]